MRLITIGALIGWGISAAAWVKADATIDRMAAAEKDLIAADAILKSADERLKVANDELAQADAELKRSCAELEQLLVRR